MVLPVRGGRGATVLAQRTVSTVFVTFVIPERTTWHSFGPHREPNQTNMNKVLLSIAALALAGGATAQVNIGAKLGLNYNIWTQADVDPSNGIGFHLGGYAQVPISDNLTFQPELLYSGRGVKETIDETLTYTNGFGDQVTEKQEGDATVSVGYLEVPLLLGIQAGEGFNIHVGPVLALRMGYNAKVDYTETTTVNGSTSTSSISAESSDDTGVASFDFGAAVGLNYELESGLNFGLRYIRGFSSIVEDAVDPVNYNGLQVSLGYTFMKN